MAEPWPKGPSAVGTRQLIEVEGMGMKKGHPWALSRGRSQGKTEAGRERVFLSWLHTEGRLLRAAPGGLPP